MYQIVGVVPRISICGLCIVTMGENEQRVTVINETRNLKTGPFTHPDDQISTGKAWEEWIEGLEREFRYFRITSADDKADALIIYGGKEIARLARSLPDTPQDDAGEPRDTYGKLKQKLDDYFTPRKNKHHARYLFLKTKMHDGETTAAYAARVREKAVECDFGTTLDDRILEHMIQTMSNTTLIQRAIGKGWNLNQLLSEATQLEDVRLQVADMNTDDKHDHIHKLHRQKPAKQGQGAKTQQPCAYCGMTGRHPAGRDCPAYGKRCNKCNRFNHFASVCKSSAQTHNRDARRKPFGKKQWKAQPNVKKTMTSEQQSDTSSDEGFMQHMKQAKIIIKKVGGKNKRVTVQIANLDAQVEIDSGADVNVIDEHQFKALVHRAEEKLTLKPTEITLHTLQTELDVKGEFHTTVRNTTRGVKTQFIVIRGKMDSLPLIGRDTATALGMLEIRPDGSLKDENHLKSVIKQVKKLSSKMPQSVRDILKANAEIFDGIGKIYDKKNKKEMYAHFHMREDAVPVAQKPRPVPFYLQKPLKQWLDHCVEEDIFETIPEDQPITWCSPLVVQPKPRYNSTPKDELQPHMIRASVDLRVVNKQMERSRITQTPVVEDFTYTFHDCKVFSKLDMRQGYHQLILDPSSRDIATFSTPWGNMRPKRLVFGAKSSQDLFDETIYRIFGDIPKCLSQRDDILIGGRTLEEHNETLKKVFERATDFNITFNEEKCQFAAEQLEFYGYLFTKDGLKPTEDKVKAVKESPPPESKEAVRSFLGMIGYLSKFIPHYASITAPLRELTKKDVKFKWGEKEQTAFGKLKDSITCDDIVTYFDPERKIILRTEASFHEGLSAGLFQETDRGLQPVHYISRAMSDAEKRYSQTEKDALAISWAKDRLKIYLLGAPKFKIITAHKPLLPMFNKPTSKLPPRIDKWVMNMQDVDFELVYEPGKDEADPMDYLSRHPLPEKSSDGTEPMIKQIIMDEHAVVLDRIREETKIDPQLSKLQERIYRDDWETFKKDEDIQPFYPIRHDLYTAEGVIFRLNCIVIPTSLQRKVIKAGHKLGHLGITKTKSMLREKYWFPQMNHTIEQILSQCYECQVTTKQHTEEPIKVSTIPEKPWEVIAIDFGGPYPDGHYNLVAVDKRTRYPEVETTHSTSFKATKGKLMKMFATHGIPKRIESDNGPPFASKDFADFAKETGFEHHKVTPKHARANGEAESFMKMLNKTEQIAHLQSRDRTVAIQEMLMGYRSTPHPATKTTPYAALMNRQVRTTLDHTNPKEEKTTRDRKMDEKDKEYKEKLKMQKENRNTSEHKLVLGDYVLLKQSKRNKWTTAFEPAFYIVYRIDGSSIGARRISDGREIYRDASQFKLANNVVQNVNERSDDQTEREQRDDWREKILQETQGHDQNTRSTVNDPPSENHNGQNEVPEPEGERRPTRNQPATPGDGPRTHHSRRMRQPPAYLRDYVTEF